MRCAIVATGSFGDILNATPIAAHLRKLGHEVHWYVASFYQSALANNTDIDKIIFKAPREAKTKTLGKVIDDTTFFTKTRKVGTARTAKLEKLFDL